MAGSARTRVAIIGGGCAGLAAAWELSKLDGFDVHVYEQSHCLGGKGASTRDAQGRIREHGLHVWLGFYENAFRMLRHCYAEVGAQGWGPGKDKGRALLHASIDDALFAQHHIGVASTKGGVESVVWSGMLPPAPGLPGEPIEGRNNPFTLASYIERCAALLKTLMLSVIEGGGGAKPGSPRPDGRSSFDEWVDLDFSLDGTRKVKLVIERMARLLRNGSLVGGALLLQAVTIVETSLQKLQFAPQVADSVLSLLEAATAQTRKLLRDLVEIDAGLRWKTEVIDLVMTIMVGMYRDRVLLDHGGFDAINSMDYREWLRSHGATNGVLESRFLAGIYDLVFAYEGGDAEKPRLAAGVALRGALRMFLGYRGAMFWHLRSGMGDSVFAPLYRTLRKGCDARQAKRAEVPYARRRPVHFHFRHELVEVCFRHPDDGSLRVASLKFLQRGSPKDSEDALDPQGCWPPAPEDLKDEQPRDVTLRDGEGFDAVIFATGAEPFAEMVRGSKVFDDVGGWKAMALNTHTVATGSAQVWLDRDLSQLGWNRGPVVVAALGRSFDTWADMTHTLAAENDWRQHGQAPLAPSLARSVAYFCRAAATDAPDDAKRRLEQLLRSDMAAAWPDAYDPNKPATALDCLMSEDGQHSGGQYLDDQHLQINHAGSARYTLSLPGSLRHRMSPLDPSIANMSVAGDWTANGLDAGCVEAAVMSGMLAAHAISGGQPPLDAIVGFDHP